MSLKLNIKIYIFFFIFILSTSIKLPMTSKLITIKSYSNNIQDNKYINTRFLNEKNMDITDFKYFLMETELCIGTPGQCFKVLYDTGSTYLILGIENSNLKFKKGFNSLLSESFTAMTDKKLLAIPFKSSVIWAREARDKASISENFKYPYLFSFLLSWNSTENYNFDGILGLGNYYPKRDDENSFDERFSFIHYLKLNGIISKLIFGHEYRDRTHGSIYFGEEPKSMRNGYFKCKVQNFISYANKWHCQLLSMYFSNGDNYTTLANTAAFDTGYSFIKGPIYQANVILDRLQEIGGDKCEEVFQKIDENNELITLVCDRDVKISDFPDISFDIVGFKMTLLRRDLFRKVIVRGGETKYEAIIIADSTYQYWNFGEPILKNYDMVFNYEDNTVGFRVNNNFLGGDWTSVIILGIILICFTFTAYYIIKNRKTIFKKHFKEEDLNKLKDGNELKEGLQMQDL